jgi:hypothetical protein
VATNGSFASSFSSLTLNANLHGLVYSPKLAYGLTGKGSREGTIEQDGTFTFEAGKVDFSPDRSVTPGSAPNFFPPKAYKPGSVGDASYSAMPQLPPDWMAGGCPASRPSPSSRDGKSQIC